MNNIFVVAAATLFGFSRRAGSFEMIMLGRLLVGVSAGTVCVCVCVWIPSCLCSYTFLYPLYSLHSLLCFPFMPTIIFFFFFLQND